MNQSIMFINKMIKIKWLIGTIDHTWFISIYVNVKKMRFNIKVVLNKNEGTHTKQLYNRE